MPFQNRVTPLGEIVVSPARGTMLGNRGGCFHRDDQTLTSRRWASRQWICCVLAFKNRRRSVMQPGHYTELFFLDEATALAAGHRPCFECRRDDARRFATLWSGTKGRPDRARADDMDRELHVERLAPDRSKRTVRADLGSLPDGAMVLWSGRPALVVGRTLRPWSLDGYEAAAVPRTNTEIDVLTPKTIVAVLEAGYAPGLHPSASS